MNACLKVVIRLAFLGAPLSSYGLDTTEPFDIGFSDFEMAGAFNGIGLDKGEKEFSWEGFVGVGITDAFSASFLYTLSSNEYLKGDGTDEFSLGLFYTLMDSDIFKLDLVGSFSSGGTLNLGTEINSDAKIGGIQFTLNENLSNQAVLNIGPADEIAFETSIELLLYLNTGASGQLMTAMDLAWNHTAPANQETFTIGALKFGYNLMLNNSFEILPEIALDIPESDEDFSAGVGLQFISTLPVGK